MTVPGPRSAQPVRAHWWIRKSILPGQSPIGLGPPSGLSLGGSGLQPLPLGKVGERQKRWVREIKVMGATKE